MQTPNADVKKEEACADVPLSKEVLCAKAWRPIAM
jgi:hypothetical protein